MDQQKNLAHSLKTSFWIIKIIVNKHMENVYQLGYASSSCYKLHILPQQNDE